MKSTRRNLLGWAWVGLIAGLAACASTAPKPVNPGIARFVGVWTTPSGANEATLRVNEDQSALLSVGGRGAVPIPGHCRPGSDTLTFIEDDGPRSEHRVVLFSTRPDLSLSGSLNGVPLRLLRR